MKKINFSTISKLSLVLVILVGVAGCGREEKVSPLSSKKYDAIAYNSEESDEIFSSFMIEIVSEYGLHRDNFSDYIKKHEKELDDGKSFSDFDDYETELDGYYKWCYQVMNFDTDKVPSEYVAAWNRLKEIATYSKDCMNKMYDCDQEERDLIIQEMSVKVTNDLNNIVGLISLP